MTKLLEQAITTAQQLPPEMQDEIARLVLTYAGSDRPVIMLTPEEEAELDLSEAEAARGEFATEEEVAAIFAKYQL